MIKNIFLDRDGIINEVVLRNSKAESPRTLSEFNIRQEFVDFYNKTADGNYNLFVVSNQPDIARNKMDIKELEMMTGQLKSSFNFKEISYCTHDDSDNCDCRKPKPGMIISILNKFKLEKQASVIVGDSSKDIAAGKNAGIKTILLQTGYNRGYSIKADYFINSLLEILSLIKV